MTRNGCNTKRTREDAEKGGFTLVHTTHQGRPWSGIERVVAKKNF